MRPETKSTVRSALFGLGFRVNRRTPPANVLNLIRKLRPQDCGLDLIRIGAPADGGYLVPNDLDGIEYCFSPGVSSVSDFEDHLANLHIRSFLADASVDSPQIVRPELTFDKKFLGASDRGDYITLASWKNKYLKDYGGDLMLQMDIEGSEYEVILNLPEALLAQFRILVIEFHNLDRLFDPFVFRLIASSFERLLDLFHVVHLHPNGSDGILKSGEIEIPRTMEFTFINKERADSKGPRSDFPHRLDADNIPGTSLPLPKCWYSS